MKYIIESEKEFSRSIGLPDKIVIYIGQFDMEYAPIHNFVHDISNQQRVFIHGDNTFIIPDELFKKEMERIFW
jgi:hypothetical protein